MTNSSGDYAPYTDPAFIEERQKSWANTLPAGYRPPADPAAAREWTLRDTQTQRVENRGLQIKKIVPCQFVGHMTKGPEFKANGDFVFQIVVPYEMRDLAMPMLDAIGLPLSIDVQLWKPFAEETGLGDQDGE